MICMSAEQLADVEDVLAIPYGVTKAPAVLAAVRSGLVTSLVTHDAMARVLLDGSAASRIPAQRGIAVPAAGAPAHTETLDVPVTQWKHSVTTMDP